MALLDNINKKFLLLSYFFLSAASLIYAVLIKEFPADLSLLWSVIGPLVFLFPLKWLPASIIYFIVSSLVIITFFVFAQKVSKDWLAYVLFFLLITSWLLCGFIGLLYIGFTGV